MSKWKSVVQKPKPGKLRSLQLAFWMMLKTAKRNRWEWPLISVCGGVHWKKHSPYTYMCGFQSHVTLMSSASFEPTVLPVSFTQHHESLTYLTYFFSNFPLILFKSMFPLLRVLAFHRLLIAYGNHRVSHYSPVLEC